jgi:hypothetical protein
VCNFHLYLELGYLTRLTRSEIDNFKRIQAAIFEKRTIFVFSYPGSNSLLASFHYSETFILEDDHDSKDATASLSFRPTGLIFAKTIQNIACDKPLKTLFDPRSDKNFHK